MVSLARPITESNPPIQRIMTNSVPMTTMTPVPLSAPNSVPATHVTSPHYPVVSAISPSTQSKLAGTNGISSVKTGGFAQNTVVQSSQESSQDKQVEQAKLVSYQKHISHE